MDLFYHNLGLDDDDNDDQDDDNEDDDDEDQFDHFDENEFTTNSTNKSCRCKDCLTCCYSCLRNYRLHSNSYTHVFKAYKVALTLSVSQVACERTFSKLKHVKNPLRNQLTDNHLDSLLMMCVERDILANISNNDVINELAASSTEMRKLLGYG